MKQLIQTEQKALFKKFLLDKKLNFSHYPNFYGTQDLETEYAKLPEPKKLVAVGKKLSMQKIEDCGKTNMNWRQNFYTGYNLLPLISNKYNAGTTIKQL